ncbi:GntR family transcriptional regulator [Bacillus mycoides]|uniref:GntR family transcriptional regulator n=1 Tax=Bacillus cereus TaxID=1396 RepID=A0A1S9TL78_BACCE|nr:GntR family transcriptional regulator [Bacillus cereus]OOR62597.1 GntR family transcriptional regulator [Bacillus mycoides]QBP90912.1 GntR family transcriptional regulator [Bacillus mycoides]QWH61494.1 GntR family transcriptional regulator [Bacillus mycoides]TKI37020.1 GntR family transcriptional regulator [Bacillus mycoides]
MKQIVYLYIRLFPFIYIFFCKQFIFHMCYLAYFHVKTLAL